MRRLLPPLLPAVALLASCDGRFNSHYRLITEPKPAEAVGIYLLTPASSPVPVLRQMGYTSFGSTVVINADFTFTGNGVPACCLHGWDETTYPFTGGLYDIKGTWKIVKVQDVYDLELPFVNVVETTGRRIEGPKLAEERKIPTTVNATLIKGEEPFTIGFNVFNGDFWPVAYDRVP